MPYVGHVDPDLLYGPFGLPSDPNDAFGLEKVEELAREAFPRTDFAPPRIADRQWLARVVRVQRDAIPHEEMGEDRLQDAPENAGAVLGVWLLLAARRCAIDRKVRIDKLRLGGDGHAGKAASPRPGCLGQEEEGRLIVVGREVGAQVLLSDGGSVVNVEVIHPVSVEVEKNLRRGDVEQVLLK